MFILGGRGMQMTKAGGVPACLAAKQGPLPHPVVTTVPSPHPVLGFQDSLRAGHYGMPLPAATSPGDLLWGSTGSLGLGKGEGLG